MGSSSVISIILGILRNKTLALVLGPSGMGLTGLYQSIASLVNSVSGLGIGESGVRQIAVAQRKNDKVNISDTVLSLKRVALLSGAFGFLLLFVLSKYISQLTFTDTTHTVELAVLSLTVFLGTVSGAQTALVQGMQRIGDLAKISILSAFFGTALGIPMILLLKERGIILFLLTISGTSIISSWFYSKRIQTLSLKRTWRESLHTAYPLLKLGVALMIGSLIITGAQYLVRVIVIRGMGLDAAGIYQASSMLSTVFVGILLNAMVTDYYPRLSAASHDDIECRSLINKQVEVGLLFAAPGVLATLTLAPLVIAFFYSTKFMGAVEVLRWQILGVFLQVVTWPMGFLFRAKGAGRLFVWTEVFHNSSYVLLVWLAIKYLGLPGIGVAFFGMNALYLLIVYAIVRQRYGFSFSPACLRDLGLFSLTLGLVFVAPTVFPKYHLPISLTLSLAATAFSVKRILKTAGGQSVWSLLLRFRLPKTDKAGLG